MTKFFFDSGDPIDDEDDGLELPDVEAALSAALQAFPDMIRDRDPMTGQTSFGLTVRTRREPLFRITLELLLRSDTEDVSDQRRVPDQRARDGMQTTSRKDSDAMETENELIAGIAARHGLSKGAVEAALAALRHGNGTMAQFSHADFGGMAQWSRGGMSMVGDMFNSDMKARLDGMMTDLAAKIGDGAVAPADSKDGEPSSSRDMSSSRRESNPWPSEFGAPSSSGGQNDMRYAFFPKVQRLVVEDGSERTTYDTGTHMISGVSQQQSGSSSVKFQSQDGEVRLDELTIVK